MDLRKQIDRLIQTHKILPKKSLGQHFLIDEYVLQLLISYADLQPSDIVLEVGAGFGFLTRMLANKSNRIIAIEADSDLVKILRKQCLAFENVEIVEGDILKVSIPKFNKVVCNPPFSISSPLLFRILDQHFDIAIMTLQREFAMRLNATTGSKDYSRLTASIFYRANVDVLDIVSKEFFFPQPKVDAVIVKLAPKKSRPFRVENEIVFEEILRVMFSQRNRKARKAIIPLFSMYKLEEEEIKKVNQLPFLGKRVRELAPVDFGELANELSKKENSL
jgi:16S rRNA (adenine1518-N6/adenine1519-N6)-dimethyltransferase